MNPGKRFTAAWRRPGCAALAVLTGCLLWGAAAGARADLDTRTRALQTTIDQTPASKMAVNSTANYALWRHDVGNPAVTINSETRQIYNALAPNLPVQAPSRSWADLLVPPAALSDAPRSAITAMDTPPKVSIDYRQNLAQHARLLAGHWPDKAAVTTGATKGGPAADTTSLEIAVTPSTLARFDAHIGSELSIDADRLVIVAVVEPTDPAGLFWQSLPALAAPVLDTPLVSPPFWNTAVFIGADEIDALSQLFPSGSFELSWTVPLATTGYTPAELPALADALTAGLNTESLALTIALTSDTNFGIGLNSYFTPTVAHFLKEQQGEELETAMPAVSLAMIGLIALVLLSRATVDRRGQESALLLARGAPLRELTGRAITDAALTVPPAAAAAVLAILALPGTTSAGLWWYLALIPLTALLAPAVFTIAHYARPVYRRARSTNRPKRTAARRITAQAALAALCLAGLEQVRTHGLAPGIGIDAFTACTPVLAAALTALLALDLGPAALRSSLSAARRRRGAIGLLGLGRTARTPASAAITVFTLALGLSTADLALALSRSPGAPGSRAAADPLQSAATTFLTLLAAAALGAGCLIVALAAGADASERRVVTTRLTVMGLTPGQSRAIALVELCAPIALAAAAGTLAAPPLLWTVRPALAEALGGSAAQLTVATLAAPVLTVVPLALAAGSIGAALARRDPAGALRLGDQET